MQVTGKPHSGSRTDAKSEPHVVWRRKEGMGTCCMRRKKGVGWFIAAMYIPKSNGRLWTTPEAEFHMFLPCVRSRLWSWISKSAEHCSNPKLSLFPLYVLLFDHSHGSRWAISWEVQVQKEWSIELPMITAVNINYCKRMIVMGLGQSHFLHTCTYIPKNPIPRAGACLP
jgi:hypothetical protein